MSERKVALAVIARAMEDSSAAPLRDDALAFIESVDLDFWRAVARIQPGAVRRALTERGRARHD
jgi:hypothetical protein